MDLPSLPVELIIRTLLYLPPASISACQQTCHSLHAVITSSDTLQYLLALYKHGMIDNPLCTLPTSTKLSMLEKRELAWKNLQEISHRIIDTSHLSSRLPGLARGFFLNMHKNKSQFGLQCVSLSAENDGKIPEWTKKAADGCVNYGLAVDEHNLIVFVHATRTGHEGYLIFMLTLCDFTTGEPHPLAENATIHLSTSDPGVFHSHCIFVKVAGENLVFAYGNSSIFSDRYNIYIYNWFTGALKMEAPITAENASFTFLREDLILIPNGHKNTFDIYHIPTSSNVPTSLVSTPVLCLALPSIEGFSITSRGSCRADTIATSQAMNSPKFVSPSRPFTGDPTYALELFACRFLLDDRRYGNFAMVVRKSVLLSLALSTLASTPITEGPSSASGPSSIQFILWSSWGPSASRWIDATGWMPVFCATSSGQRFAVLTKTAYTSQAQIKVLDFNPHRVKDFKAKGLTTDSDSAERVCIKLVNADTYDAGSCQSSRCSAETILVSRLPYIETMLKRVHDLDSLLIDEEHLIGLANGRMMTEVPRIEPIRFG